MGFAPIVLFVYSRLDHTKRTVEALKNNLLADESNLIIFSDAPKNEKSKKAVEEVRKYIHSIKGFKSVKIIERKNNVGLANSIIDGVTKVVNKYGKIIVLEDDLVTSKYFLNFMNDSLELYKNESKVISISGYTYPVGGLAETFFIKGTDCWGWATWKRG
ncbi:MAG: glycosyltransferase [Sphaerochaetaceae bacterium]|nr:glycosyltransferase [Sphaerochaetaceae bacterium]